MPSTIQHQAQSGRTSALGYDPGHRSGSALVASVPFSVVPVAVCTFAYIFCITLSVGPLHDLAPMRTTIWVSTLLAQISKDMPANLRLASVPYISRQDTGYLESMVLLALAFAAYGLCALFIHSRGRHIRQRVLLFWIGLGTVVGGAIYVFTPGLLSLDIYSYASYGRLLLVYHANPYFVPAAAFPHDPLYPYIFWKNAVPLYGPVWIGVCAFLSAIAGADHMAVVLAFRGFALAMHLLNMVLIAALLQTRGRSPQTVALGALLYGWNPLVLLESSLNGHVDVSMLTFILLGLLSRAYAERAGYSRLETILLPLIPFMLAVLIKYIALPAVVLSIWVACRTVLAGNAVAWPIAGPRRRLQWGAGLLTFVGATALCLVLAAAFYGPFLIGHGVKDALNIYAAQPSTNGAINSLLFTIRTMNKTHPLPASLAILMEHNTWTWGTLAAMIVALGGGAIWLWRAPTTRTLAFALMATWSAFLVLTPWFFPWYLIALVGLAAVSLPVGADRLGRALVAFALTFSASSFLVYYSTVVGWLLLSAKPPQTDWALLMSLVAVGMPLLVFVGFLVPVPRLKHRAGLVLNTH